MKFGRQVLSSSTMHRYLVMGAFVSAVAFGGARPAAAAAPTFTRDVAPIIFRECVPCHREGQSAPMALLTYQQVRPWAKAIRAKVLDRSMPPWSAEDGHRKVLNQRRLEPAEIDTLVSWVDGGAPEGDPRDLPAAPTFVDEWRIGTPDSVFTIPVDVAVPETGNTFIKYFVVSTSFAEDRWIDSLEVRPTDPAHVHHVIMYHRPGDQGDSTPEQGGDVMLGSSLAVYGPGADPVVYAPGVALRLPKGDSLIFEVHYLPNGKAGRDRTRLGLKFRNAPPESEVHALSMSNPRLHIPAGASAYEVKAKSSFNEPFTILSVMPHAHLRGKDFEYRLIYPDGRSEVILAVPRYDWRWQTAYTFAEPIAVPPLTTLEITAHFDNSSGNRSNPDPSADVRWGWRPADEMMFSYITFIAGTDRAQR